MHPISVKADVRNHSTRYGLLVILGGIVLLLALRLWASPIARTVTGRSEVGLVEFLLIPAFLVVVTVGILLFLWDPDSD